MRIALINPLFPDWENRRAARAHYAFPSGLGYIAACLRRAGHEARVFIPEPASMPMARVWEDIAAFGPGLVGLTSMTANFMEARRVAAEAKRRFGCPVVMGGPHVTALPRSSLQSVPELDAVIMGEGEIGMTALAAEYSGGAPDLAKVPGAAYISNGQFAQNPRPDPIEDLDSLPYPALDLLSGPFRDPEGNTPDTLRVKLVTSRGCPGQCNFCANICMGRRFRAHSPERVVAEIKNLVSAYGVRRFHIHDDCFTADARRAAAICELILKEGLRVSWDAAGRVNTLLDEDLIALMKRAGCYRVQLGIESGNQRVSDLMGKHTTLEAARRCCALLRKRELDYLNFFLVGAEGETRATVHDTIRFARELGGSLAMFTVVIPFPGTPLFEKYYSDFDRPDTDWTAWTGSPARRPCEPRHTALSNAELQRLMIWAHLRYYGSPAQLLRTAASVLKG